jgi:hypothetical protein
MMFHFYAISSKKFVKVFLDRQKQIQIGIFEIDLIEFCQYLIRKELICPKGFWFHGPCLKLVKKH